MKRRKNTFKIRSWLPKRVQVHRHCVLYVFLGFVLYLPGCGDGVQTATVERWTAFKEAGPKPLAVDMDAIRAGRVASGPYRVVSGDVLEITMPLLLQVVSVPDIQLAQSQGASDRPYLCRVSRRGTITLPGAREIGVLHASLAEIEEEIIDAYHNEVTHRPSIFVRVLEYQMFQVSIVGAVAKPGVYSLRHDQMSLAALLMEAGGIVEEGAAVIRVARADVADARTVRSKALVEPGLVGQAQAAWSPVAALSRPNVADGRFRYAAPASPAHAVFRREGRLCTTGWLTIERDGHVLAHGWLDLGSEVQRKVFLTTMAGGAEESVTRDLQEWLSRLAAHLESDVRSSSTGRPWILPGWPSMADRQSQGQLSGAAVHTAGFDGDAEAMNEGVRLASRPASRDSGANEEAATTLVLPIVGFNVPFHDVALRAGDMVMVEHIQEPLFTVLGLVNRPGNFPYPQNAQYNVAQAIAFAGGLDPVADPRYVTVYRLTEGDEVIHVSFQLVRDDSLTDALKTFVRPGDVVAVENTPRTRTNTLIHNMLRLNMGVYVSGRDLWNGN